MKSADEGKMVNCRPLLSIHTLKRAKRIWFLLRQPGISQLFGFDTRVSARKIIACSSKHGTDVFMENRRDFGCLNFKKVLSLLYIPDSVVRWD